MVRRLLIIVLFALPVSAQSPKYVIDDTHPSNEVMRRLGIDAYRVETGVGEAPTHVELVDRQNVRIAALTTRLLRDGSREIEYQPEGNDRFTVVWNGHVLQLLTSTGMYTLKYDDNSKEFIASEGAREAVEARRKDLVAIAETVGELHKHLVLRKSRNCVVDCGPAPGDGGGYDVFLTDGSGGGGGAPTCTGPMVRGTCTMLNLEVTFIRSAMCAAAEQDANFKCTSAAPRSCLGCCRLLPCDAFCAVGDYFCPMAGVSGQACSPP